MDIISRIEAISQGLKWYFTRKPCKRGHVSERNVNNGGCRECKSITNKAYMQESGRVRYQRYFVSHMLYHAKRRAKQKNVVFELKKNDIDIPERCPVLGIKFDHDGGNAGMETTPTLDRVDNSKGYTKDNICIISFRANNLKSTATLENFERIKGSPDEKKKIIEYMLAHSQKKELNEV